MVGDNLQDAMDVYWSDRNQAYPSQTKIRHTFLTLL